MADDCLARAEALQEQLKVAELDTLVDDAFADGPVLEE